MSEAINSVSNTQNTQQAQNINQSSNTASQQLDSPNASAIQAFNNNATDQANADVKGGKDIFGDQTHVDIKEENLGDGKNQIPGFELDNGRRSEWFSKDELKSGWDKFLNSKDAPTGATQDLVESPWGDMVSGSVLKAYLNHMIDNRVYHG